MILAILVIVIVGVAIWWFATQGGDDTSPESPSPTAPTTSVSTSVVPPVTTGATATT